MKTELVLRAVAGVGLLWLGLCERRPCRHHLLGASGTGDHVVFNQQPAPKRCWSAQPKRPQPELFGSP
jgi:hypothetical protein